MLDVRITAYVVPIAEQPQASLTPVIAVRNYADEGAVITGLIRIYRETTGLLIYSSELAVTQLDTMSSANIAALTPFDPPAPADDDYYILADIVATSYLPGPPKSSTLGAWHFDIKTPPMGEAPAGHHVTHELGGSDPIKLDNLSTPDDNSDLDVSIDTHGLAPKAPNDATRYLDGTGAYSIPAHEGASGLHHSTDFLSPVTNYGNPPWYGETLANGTSTPIAGDATHPGVHRIAAAAVPNSGWRIHHGLISYLIAGGEWTQCIYRPQLLAGTTMHFGFCDTSTFAAPVDGVWLHQDPITGIIYGRTMENSAGSQTVTGYQLVTNTWYRLKIVVNPDASRVDFYVYDMAGAELWTDNLITNIPTGAGRLTGHQVIISNTGSGAVDLGDFDFLDAHFVDRRNLSDQP